MNVDVNKKTEAFKKSVSSDYENVYVETYGEIGLRVIINHIQDHVMIDVSSKSLGRDCTELISKTNINIIYKMISNIIDIDYDVFIGGQPKYCECTNDIKVTKCDEKIEAFYNLSIVQTDFKVSPKIYKRNNQSSSFWMKKNIITKDIMQYISIYNKMYELTDCRKSENQLFLDSLNQIDRSLVLNYYENILRIETKCQSKKSIYSTFKLNNNFTLNDLLNSNVNVNSEILNKIYGKLFTENYLTKKMKPREFDQLNTLQQFNNDINAIVLAKSNIGCTRNKSKIKKEYKDVLTKSTRMEKQEKIKELTEIIRKLEWK